MSPAMAQYLAYQLILMAAIAAREDEVVEETNLLLAEWWPRLTQKEQDRANVIATNLEGKAITFT